MYVYHSLGGSILATDLHPSPKYPPQGKQSQIIGSTKQLQLRKYSTAI